VRQHRHQIVTTGVFLARPQIGLHVRIVQLPQILVAVVDRLLGSNARGKIGLDCVTAHRVRKSLRRSIGLRSASTNTRALRVAISLDFQLHTILARSSPPRSLWREDVRSDGDFVLLDNPATGACSLAREEGTCSARGGFHHSTYFEPCLDLRLGDPGDVVKTDPRKFQSSSACPLLIIPRSPANVTRPVPSAWRISGIPARARGPKHATRPVGRRSGPRAHCQR